MLIVTALMAVTLFAPLAWFAGEAGEFGLYAFSLKTAAGEAVQPTVYMGVVLALACVLPFITIFRPSITSMLSKMFSFPFSTMMIWLFCPFMSYNFTGF